MEKTVEVGGAPRFGRLSRIYLIPIREHPLNQLNLWPIIFVDTHTYDQALLLPLPSLDRILWIGIAGIRPGRRAASL